MFEPLILIDGDIDVQGTAAYLRKRYPAQLKHFCDASIEFYAKVAYDSGVSVGACAYTDSGSKEHEFMFVFARWLKRNIKAEFRKSFGGYKMRDLLAPFSIVFARALEIGGAELANGSVIDWEDEAQVMQHFRTTYSKARYATGEDPLIEAFELSEKPLFSPAGLNEHATRLVHIAHRLQQGNPDEPIQFAAGESWRAHGAVTPL